MENSIHRANSLKICLVKEYFENVTSSGSTISEGVCGIYADASYEPFNMTHLAVYYIEFVLEDIEMPNPYGIIVHGYEFERVGVEV